MANVTTPKVLADMEVSFGEMRRLPGGNSLFVVGDEAARVCFRYSNVHRRGQAFFGLRQLDLRQLEGHNSFIALLTDDGLPAVFLPYAAFEGLFQERGFASSAHVFARQSDARRMYLRLQRQRISMRTTLKSSRRESSTHKGGGDWLGEDRAMNDE